MWLQIGKIATRICIYQPPNWIFVYFFCKTNHWLALYSYGYWELIDSLLHLKLLTLLQANFICIFTDVFQPAKHFLTCQGSYILKVSDLYFPALCLCYGGLHWRWPGTLCSNKLMHAHITVSFTYNFVPLSCLA